MRQVGSLIGVFLLLDAMAFATIFGTVRGIVHDPQHRPIQGAHVTLKAQNSDFTQSADSNSNGEFDFSSVPIGNYTITVASNGFQEMRQEVMLESDTTPVLHFQLAVAGVNESVVVPETVGAATTDSVTPRNGEPHPYSADSRADRTNGMEMITDYVPPRI